MKNELVLDNYGVQEMRAEERIDVDGGDLKKFLSKLGEKIVKFEWEGWFDGDPTNDEAHLYLLGIKIF